MGIKKHRISCWFQIHWKSLNKCTKKVISNNVTELCTFFTFTHVRQTCFSYNFFLCIFKTFSTDLKSAWNSAFFDTFLTKKIFFGPISTFSNFEANCAKNGAKNQINVLHKCVLDLNFPPIKGSVFFIFEKSYIRCNLTGIGKLSTI
jgi:hypothetical protein